jgi:hypothetical protein
MVINHFFVAVGIELILNPINRGLHGIYFSPRNRVFFQQLKPSLLVFL